jgi:hypothetical protein
LSVHIFAWTRPSRGRKSSPGRSPPSNGLD